MGPSNRCWLLLNVLRAAGKCKTLDKFLVRYKKKDALCLKMRDILLQRIAEELMLA